MIVGVDFDNTIVSYEALFREVALAAGLVEPGFDGGKHALRETLRARPSGEERWTWLQGQVYGPRLDDARAFPGFREFAARCRALDVPLYLISHKSEFAAANPGGTNLRDAARRWLQREFPDGTFAGLYFEDDRAAKIARIGALACTQFIDDLAEVFLEPGFPSGTARWLFDPFGSQPPVPHAERFASWEAIERRLQDERRIWNVAAELAGGMPVGVSRSGAGGNNRIYRIDLLDRSVALKIYGVPDNRGRREREGAALRFLNGRGLPVPAALGSDERTGAALLEWIEGEPVGPPQPGDVGQAVDVVTRLHELRHAPAARALPAAAEAGLRLADVWRDIETRLARLAECTGELTTFLGDFEARFSAHRARLGNVRDAERMLGRDLATLSPSDFGFHNALRRQERLVFLDFEYFGWDDPVKLAADFTLHPGMTLRAADIKEWLAGAERVFGGDLDFSARLADCFPTYALKWCLIVLNEFRPEVWERRLASRPELHWADAKACQLEKARRLLERAGHGKPIAGG